MSIPLLPCVVLIRNDVADRLWIFTSPKSAEEKFLEVCEKTLDNWGSYTDEDKKKILDQGYETFHNGSICLVWGDQM